jgi:hypothetical protein
VLIYAQGGIRKLNNVKSPMKKMSNKKMIKPPINKEEKIDWNDLMDTKRLGFINEGGLSDIRNGYIITILTGFIMEILKVMITRDVQKF